MPSLSIVNPLLLLVAVVVTLTRLSFLVVVPTDSRAFLSPTLQLLYGAAAESLESRQALVDLYRSTNGDTAWRTECKAGWAGLTTSSPPPTTFCNGDTGLYSTFHGVHCTQPNGTILQIALADCGLTGTLPDSLSVLSNLTRLELSGNSLSGTLPAKWGDGFDSLGYIIVSKNRLTGSIPDSWTRWKNLVNWVLNRNQLTGTLPKELKGMTKLEWISWYDNQLSGTLPAEWAAAPSLLRVAVDVNRLSGTLPIAWRSFQALRYLFLADNQLNGTLPEEWAEMNLIQFETERNAFTGTIPASWARMALLANISVHQNQLTGPLPDSWGILPLEHVSVAQNRLSGTLPASWGNSGRTAVTFTLLQNEFTGTLPPEWSKLTNLKNLFLSENQLSGTLPPQWGQMTSLQVLWLQQNRLTGTLPASWSSLSTLLMVYLHMNRLHGNLPSSWPSGIVFIPPKQLYCEWKCYGAVDDSSNSRRCEPLLPTNNGDADPLQCNAITVFDNCLTVTPLPPAPAVSWWNWGTAALRPQRNAEECVSATISATPSLPPPKGQGRTPSSFSKVRVVGATGAVSTAGSLVAGFVGGTAMGSAVQRASLLRALSACGAKEGGGDSETDNNNNSEDGDPLTTPLDVASSPLRLGFGASRGSFLRGSIVGNFVLLLACGAVGLAAAVCRSRLSNRSWTESLADVHMPGILHIPVMFLLQPLTTSSVWCLWMSSEEDGGEKVLDPLLGAIGLLFVLLYILWSTWRITVGNRAAFRVKQVSARRAWWRHVPWSIRHWVCGWHDATYTWFNRRHKTMRRDQKQRKKKKMEEGHPELFYVERYGHLLDPYRQHRGWFLCVESLATVLCGVLGAVVLQQSSSSSPPCGALQGCFLAVTLFTWSICVGALPFCDPIDHMITMLLSLLNTLSGIFLVVTSEEGVATLDAAETLLADLQMWIGLALMVVAVGLLLVSESCRQWLVAKLLHGRGGAPTKLQVAEREEEDEEEEDHNAAPKFSLHLRTEPAQQSVRQREALNRLVERICKAQQKKHRHDQQYQKYSANLPPPC